MEWETYSLTLLVEDQSPTIAVLRLCPDSEDHQIELQFDQHEFVGSGVDFFESFCQIREQFESLGILPHCYGADLHSFPSGMCRGMGSGMKVYRLTVGRPAKMDDLKEIFDSDEDVVPATVADQEAFFEKWLASLR